MRRSTITRKPVSAGAQCEWAGRDEIRCTAAATEQVNVTSYPEAGRTITSGYLFCGTHADEHVSAYVNEWRNHPQMFED